jgi:CO dehydrogenase nickel-insertion accessory protein CooC1
VKQLSVIVNNAPAEPSQQFLHELAKLHIDVLGFIPEDSLVPLYDIEGRSLVDLPDSSPAAAAFDLFAKRIFV